MRVAGKRVVDGAGIFVHQFQKVREVMLLPEEVDTGLTRLLVCMARRIASSGAWWNMHQ